MYCDGVGWVYTAARTALSSLIPRIRIKFAFVYVIPCNFVHGDQPEGARECLRQLLSVPEDQLDSHSRYWLHNLLHDLENVAGGGEPSAAMLRLVRALKSIPLSEGPGEGYHRGTHMTIGSDQ